MVNVKLLITRIRKSGTSLTRALLDNRSEITVGPINEIHGRHRETNGAIIKSNPQKESFEEIIESYRTEYKYVNHLSDNTNVNDKRFYKFFQNSSRLKKHLLNYSLLGKGKNYSQIEAFLEDPIQKRIIVIVKAWIRLAFFQIVSKASFFRYFYDASMKKDLKNYYQDLIRNHRVYESYNHNLRFREENE